MYHSPKGEACICNGGGKNSRKVCKSEAEGERLSKARFTGLPSDDLNLTESLDRKEVEKIIARVDDFIERLRDMDLVTTPQGQRLTIKYPNEKEEKTFGFELEHAIIVYEQFKVMYTNLDDPQQLKIRFSSANACQILIDKALLWGAFQESEGVARKLRECTQKVGELERELAVLSENYEGLRRLLAQQTGDLGTGE